MRRLRDTVYIQEPGPLSSSFQKRPGAALLLYYAAALWIGILTGTPVAADLQAEMHWVIEPGPPLRGYVEVDGLPSSDLQVLSSAGWEEADWHQLLAVYAETGFSISSLIEVPPMLGTYEVQDGKIRFTPRFPLEPGLTYRAVFRGGALPQSGKELAILRLSAVYTVPKEQQLKSTMVTSVYPSADVLPENLLKFYIHFSAPMSRGGIYQYIRLLTETGAEIELPFLEIDEELWNADMTRLTLFIDPGRIKRGVRPLEEIGPALEAGRHFRLVIEESWRDATGAPLVNPFAKEFRVVEPDRTQPDPRDWEKEPARAGTRDPLVVKFGEPLDHALATRLIWVEDEHGRRVTGKIALTAQERVWRFTPEVRWSPGRYALAVSSSLEDLAGNSVGKAFEVDLFEEVKRPVGEIMRLAFELE